MWRKINQIWQKKKKSEHFRQRDFPKALDSADLA